MWVNSLVCVPSFIPHPSTQPTHPPTPPLPNPIQVRTVTKMSPMDFVPAESIQAASDVLIAAKDTDFGGYTGTFPPSFPFPFLPSPTQP